MLYQLAYFSASKKPRAEPENSKFNFAWGGGGGGGGKNVRAQPAYNITFKAEAFHGSTNDKFGVTNAVAVVLMTLGQRDYGISVRRNSSQLLFNSTCLFAFLAFSFYTADLTSLMSSVPKPLDVRSFQGVYEKELDLIVWRDTSSVDHFLMADQDSSMRKVFERGLEQPASLFAHSMDEIISRLHSEPRSVYFGSAMEAKRDLELRILPIEEAVPIHLAIGLQKDSEFLKLFNFHLQQMKEAGLFAVLNVRWTNQGVEFVEPPPCQTANVLGYDNLLFPFAIACSGLGVALVLLLAELSYSRMSFLGLST